jgi:hypothetical protein
MDREWMMMIAFGGLYLAWVILPLVPAVLIYRLFPSTTVAVSGPFAGLKVNAGGAFAAYLIVFAAVYPPLVPPTRDTIAGWSHQFWTMKADVQLLRADGSEYPRSTALVSKLNVLKPTPGKFDSYQVTLKLEEEEGEFPNVILEIPDFGQILIPLKAMTPKLTVNRFKRTISLNEPIVIKELSSGGATRPTASLQPRPEPLSTESADRPH